LKKYKGRKRGGERLNYPAAPAPLRALLPQVLQQCLLNTCWIRSKHKKIKGTGQVISS